LKHAKPVFDCQAGSDNEKSTRESVTLGTTDGIDRLPRDEHCHYRRLASPGSEFECHTLQFGIRIFIRIRDVIEDALPSGACMRRDFR
jgi:hypothetical protein